MSKYKSRIKKLLLVLGGNVAVLLGYAFVMPTGIPKVYAAGLAPVVTYTVTSFTQEVLNFGDTLVPWWPIPVLITFIVFTLFLVIRRAMRAA